MSADSSLLISQILRPVSLVHGHLNSRWSGAGGEREPALDRLRRPRVAGASWSRLTSPDSSIPCCSGHQIIEFKIASIKTEC